ncbi:hypothetical protein PspLS_04315 [Pyricularia sp. CBS 133598]|nr:hypothetical protein PspLS_04315 [Pyricularia sp. CBS 133598]
MHLSIIFMHFTAAAYGIAISAGGVIMPHLITRGSNNPADPCAAPGANSKTCCQKNVNTVVIEGEAEVN